MSEAVGSGSSAPITPLDVPSRARHVILFGGTFDPPHRAHVALPDLARRALEERTGENAWLVFVPAARSPHKDERPEAGDEDRDEMLRLATRGLDRARIWTDEIDRARAAGGDAPSYMVDTVERAREIVPESAALYLLMGADQAIAFDRWHRARRIFELAEPLVMLRAPDTSAESLLEDLRARGAWSERELARWRDAVVPIETMDLAATDLRRLLADQEGNAERLGRLLDPGVLEFIRARGLYRNGRGGG